MRHWTAYHVTLEQLLADRKPSDFEIEAELKVGIGPPRADYLLFHRLNAARPRRHARILRRLWHLLPLFAVVEYKSPTRPLRRGEWIRLIGVSCLFHARTRAVRHRGDLAAVLLVARLTPTVDAELQSMGYSRVSLGGGYYRVRGAPYEALVVAADEVAEVERDELLALVAESKMTIRTDAGFRWVRAHVIGGPRVREMQRLEGYDSVVRKALARLPAETRLEGLEPKERLQGLKPEERLQGLKPEEQVLALSNTVLRQLRPEFLKTLPAATRRKIRLRMKAH